jgi:hypothetical protein
MTKASVPERNMLLNEASNLIRLMRFTVSDGASSGQRSCAFSSYECRGPGMTHQCSPRTVGRSSGYRCSVRAIPANRGHDASFSSFATISWHIHWAALPDQPPVGKQTDFQI